MRLMMCDEVEDEANKSGGGLLCVFLFFTLFESRTKRNAVRVGGVSYDFVFTQPKTIDPHTPTTASPYCRACLDPYIYYMYYLYKTWFCTVVEFSDIASWIDSIPSAL